MADELIISQNKVIKVEKIMEYNFCNSQEAFNVRLINAQHSIKG